MTARIRKLVSDLGDTFWLVPGLLVLAGAPAALASVQLDRSSIIPQWLLEGWLYNGGGLALAPFWERWRRRRLCPALSRQEVLHSRSAKRHTVQLGAARS